MKINFKFIKYMKDFLNYICYGQFGESEGEDED